MKNMVLGALVLTFLAACGGGSGGGVAPPVAVPSATPTVGPTPTMAPQSQVHYSWDGALAPNGATQTFAHPMAASSATPIPVQATLCDPRSADCRPPGQQQYTGTDINPTIDISDAATPVPSSAPTVSPPPGQSVALQHSQAPQFTYQVNTPTSAGCGNMSVQFPNASRTIRLCVHPIITIGCVTAISNQPGGGYSTSVAGGYSFDTNSYVTDPTQADVYMTGQQGGNCNPGDPFYEQTAGPLEYRVHFPYGAVAISQGTDTLTSISPTQWTNTFTWVTFNSGENQLGNYGCGPTLNCIVLAKTKAGNYFELDVTRSNGTGPELQPQSGDGDWFTAAFEIATSGSFPT